MEAKIAYQKMIEHLTSVFDERESTAIAKIYFEDVFGLKTGIGPYQLNSEQIAHYHHDIQRLINGEPIAYVTGKTIFYGFPFLVNNHVLIPRPETEELVYWIENETQPKASLNVLDIGTGSGVIAISLKKVRPDFEVVATDISSMAIDLAKSNAKLNKVDIEFLREDILSLHSSLNFEDFDIIVSNPPYIDTLEQAQMGSSTLAFEPELALFANNQGMAFYQNFAERLAKSSRTDQKLFVELNEFRAEEIGKIFHSKNLKHELKLDLQGKDRLMCVMKK